MECYAEIYNNYITNISYSTVGEITVENGIEIDLDLDLDLDIINEVNSRPFYLIYDKELNVNQEHLDKYDLLKSNELELSDLYMDLNKLKTEYQITDNDLTAINLGIASQEVINNYKAYYAKANELQQQINNLEIENKEILNDIYVGDIN